MSPVSITKVEVDQHILDEGFKLEELKDEETRHFRELADAEYKHRDIYTDLRTNDHTYRPTEDNSANVANLKAAKDAVKAEEAIKKAEEIENNSNQLLNYTNIIKKTSIDIKKDIIEHLWKVVISDNSIDQYESNLMRRICGLIYFPDKECAEIKLKLINKKWLIL